MSLHEAIEQYLSLPNQGTLDERIFFNVLKDYNAFEQHPASQNVVRAFIGKGFLEEIWKGNKGWQMRATHQLSDFMGFQKDIVVSVVDEIALGFRNYRILNTSPEVNHNIDANIVSSEIDFRRYETTSATSSPYIKVKPDNFNMAIGDIVMVKNGVAKITAVNDSEIQIVYLKRGSDGTVRNIGYDEKMEYIITPKNDMYLKSDSGRCFYVSGYIMDDENIKFFGTYADRINKITLIPYTILRNGFKECNEDEFLSQCVDIEKFNSFKTNN